MKKLRILFVVIGVLMLSLTLMACNPPTPGPNPDPDPAAKTLSKIEVTKQPDKVEYAVGETFSKTGMVVTATYSDNSSKSVSNYQVTPSGALAKTDTKVTIKYTESSVTKEAEVTIAVKTKYNVTAPAASNKYVFTGAESIIEGAAYSFTITVANGYTGTPSFSYTIGGTAGAKLTPTENGGVYTYSIPAASVTGNIAIGAVTGISVAAPSGTAISTAEAFIAALYNKDNLNKSYYLTKDIDFAGAKLPDRFEAATGRAGNDNAFTGVLDGCGYALKNFSIEWFASGSADAGLFSQLGLSTATQANVLAGRNGVVRNLKITGATMTAYQRSGVIAGVCYGLVENCYIEATIAITGVAAYELGGGVAGELGGNNAGIGLIRNNVIKCTGDKQVGGITGYMKGGGSDQAAEMNKNVVNHIINNYIVTDDMVNKTSYSSVASLTEQGTNKLFEMSGISAITFAMDTDFWTLNTGSLPTLKTR